MKRTERSVRLGALRRRRRVLLVILDAQAYYQKNNPNGWIPTSTFYRSQGIDKQVSYNQYLQWLSTPAKKELERVNLQISALEITTK